MSRQSRRPTLHQHRVLHILIPAALDETSEFRNEAEKFASDSDKEAYVEELKQLSQQLFFEPVVHLITLKNSRQEIDQIPLEELVFNLCDGCDVDGLPGPSVARYLEEKKFLNVVGSDALFIENTLTKNGMKKIFRENLVSTPPGFGVTKATNLEEEVASWGMQYPLFVKISDSYGSVGLDEGSVCHSMEDLQKRVELLFQEFDNLTVEEFIEGQEFSVLISGNCRDENQPVIVYPPAERAFDRDLPKFQRFITFKSNWNTELQLHQYAKVEDENDSAALQDLARRAYIATSGNCFGRVDIRKRDSSGKFYVLEVNATCGVGSGSSSDFILQLAGQTTIDFFKILLSNFLQPPPLLNDESRVSMEPFSVEDADESQAVIPLEIEEEVTELLRNPTLAVLPTPVVHVIVAAVIIDEEAGTVDPSGKLAHNFGKDVAYQSELECIFRAIGYDPIIHIFNYDDVEFALSGVSIDDGIVFNACLGSEGAEVANLLCCTCDPTMNLPAEMEKAGIMFPVYVKPVLSDRYRILVAGDARDPNADVIVFPPALFSPGMAGPTNHSLGHIRRPILPTVHVSENPLYPAMRIFRPLRPDEVFLDMDLRDLARRAFTAVHGSCYGLCTIIDRNDASALGLDKSRGGLVILGVSADVRFGEKSKCGTLLKLANQNVESLSRHSVRQAAQVLTATQHAKFSFTPKTSSQPTLEIDAFKKSQERGRPISPHLTIYQPQLTWYLSALHRITGAGIAGLFYIGGIWYAVMPFSSASAAALVASAPFALTMLGKVLIAAPTVFHSVNGIRHLIWDSGSQLSVKGVYQTGYAVLAISSAITLQASGAAGYTGLEQIKPSSPLILAFDSPRYWRENGTKHGVGSSRGSGGGLFGYPDLTSPEGILKATRRSLVQAKRLVEATCAANGHGDGLSAGDLRKTVKRLDRLSDIVCCVLDACELIQNVHPDQATVKAANQAHASLSTYLSQLNTHRGLYEVLKRTYSDESIRKHLSIEELRVAELLLVDFEKSGVNMSAKTRDRFVDLNDRILRLGHEFVSNGYSSVREVEVEAASKKLVGVPKDIVADAMRRGSRWKDTAVISTDSAAAINVLRTARDEEVRRLVFLGMNSADPEQISILEEMLKTRGELAQLLKKNSYADLYLSDKMAKTPENVVSFLTSLANAHKPLAQADASKMAELKRRHVGPAFTDNTIQAWDRLYYGQFISPKTASASLSNDPFHPHHQQSHREGDVVSSYFTVGQTFAGISNLTKALYGVTLEPAAVEHGETWHSDVRKLEVVHETEGLIGVVYCDLFRREQGGGEARKFESAAQFTVRCSRRLDDDDEDRLAGPSAITDGEGSLMRLPSTEKEVLDSTGRLRKYQLPIVVLVTAFSRPVSEVFPSLLSLMEVETLFHEMGHVMHSMLARTDFQHIAGTRCPMDFVEVPSNFMEQFARIPEVLRTFARHFNTGDPLPDSLLTSQRQSMMALNSLEIQQQLQMALLDQIYHSEEASLPGFDSTKALQRLQDSVNVIPYVEGTAWQVQFSHLFSYGASYYSYFWARRWSGRLFRKWFADPPVLQIPGCPTPRHVSWREGGELIKRELWSCGGGRDPWVGLERVGVVRPGDKDDLTSGDLHDLGSTAVP
ncbi:Mitochondrial intermediate peptidase [Dinochytrium kinnereticum]|nr:Mitochondrial intermediate peptidase [Dinochytrium kinnereticum]